MYFAAFLFEVCLFLRQLFLRKLWECAKAKYNACLFFSCLEWSNTTSYTCNYINIEFLHRINKLARLRVYTKEANLEKIQFENLKIAESYYEIEGRPLFTERKTLTKSIRILKKTKFCLKLNKQICYALFYTPCVIVCLLSKRNTQKGLFHSFYSLLKNYKKGEEILKHSVPLRR